MTKNERTEIEWAVASLEAALKTFWQADAAVVERRCQLAVLLDKLQAWEKSPAQEKP